jgi:hypothetical protein
MSSSKNGVVLLAINVKIFMTCFETHVNGGVEAIERYVVAQN